MNPKESDNQQGAAEQQRPPETPATSQLLQPHLLTGYHTRGYLPHLKVEGGTYWVTLRLCDSLPQEVLRKLEDERKAWEKQQASKKLTPKELAEQWKRQYSKRMQAYLDAGMGKCWLKRDDIGGLVVKAIRFFEGKRYDLHAWVVMPNHVHVMVTPRDKWTLSSILHSWKSYTAKQANRILGRVGRPFWQVEAYDHLVRDDEEFYLICEYTINNPVSAGLCAQPEDWKFSSAFVNKEAGATPS
ncbi:MAG: transposase [candidate division KSB1 bacterium]|nr:transposase [candidate division KSB1 bacterium]MDZ7303688.1 transposase [candidate division KSB1 bacterium]